MPQYIGKRKKHSQKTYHQETVTLALAATVSFEKYERTMPALIDNSIKERYETYPQNSACDISSCLPIGRQSIELRGYR